MPQETIDILNTTITNGTRQLIEGIRVTISNSDQTFNEIYNFTNQTLTNASNFIQHLMTDTFDDFDAFVQNVYQIISQDISDVTTLFEESFNANYEPTSEELAQVENDIFKIPQVIDKFFKKFKDARDIFNDLLSYFKSLFQSRRVLSEKRISSNKRKLSSISDTIFKTAFKTITDKFTLLTQSLSDSVSSMKNVASSFDQTLNLKDYSFSPFKIDINQVFSIGEQSFTTLIQSKLVQKGKNLLLNEINNVLNLNDKLKSILSGLMPETETPLLNPGWSREYSRQFRLLTIPIVIGTANIDFFLYLGAWFQIYWGFSNGEIYIKAVPSAQVSAGITVYAEILIIRIGMYFRVDFFKGSIIARMGLNIPKWRFFLQVQLDANALGLAIGAYIQMIIFKIKWWCFSINFWIFHFRICLPYFVLEWSDWWILYEFSFVFFPLKMTLVDKYLPLSP